MASHSCACCAHKNNNDNQQSQISFAEFANEIVNYCYNTYSGMEGALYKGVKENNPANFPKIKKHGFDHILADFIVEQVNGTYKSIILRDDEHLNSHFDFIALYNHPLACVVNTISLIYGVILNGIDRSKFKIDTLDKYVLSVRFQLNKNRAKYIDVVRKCTLENHECYGDIYKMDPNDEFCKMMKK